MGLQPLLGHVYTTIHGTKCTLYEYKFKEVPQVGGLRRDFRKEVPSTNYNEFRGRPLRPTTGYGSTEVKSQTHSGSNIDSYSSILLIKTIVR